MVSTFDGRIYRNGEWRPILVWRYLSGTWKRVVVKGIPGNYAPTPNSVVVTSPVANRIVTGATLTFTASIVNGIDATFLLDGVVDLGEPSRDDDGITWSIPSRLTADIADGAHTVSCRAQFRDGTMSTSPPVTFTVQKNNVVDPGGDGDTTTLITVITPDATLAIPTVSGSTYKPVVYIDPTLGAVSSVSFAIGSAADRGYLPAESIGSGQWRLSTGFDTVKYQASVTEAGSDAVRELTKCDIWYDIRARVVLADSTLRFSPWVRALGRNESPLQNLATPVWNPNKAWAANTTTGTVQALYNSYQKQTFQVNGNTYGKELGATTIVADPDATNTYGHTAFGNVIFADVPNGYGASTAGMANSYTSNSTYGSLGDQASSGGLRWQFSTPTRFMPGEVAYYGYSFRIDPQFPTPTVSHVSIGQIYGSANGGDYDWGLFLMLDAQQKTSEHGDTVADTWQIWGNRLNSFERAKLFSMPFYRGKWVSIVYGVGFSTDPTKGWLEIYSAQPGVNSGALTQHVFPDGSARHAMVTSPKLSDGAPFHTHIYRKDAQYPAPNRVRAHLFGMKTGASAAAVNPQAYGSTIIYAP